MRTTMRGSVPGRLLLALATLGTLAGPAAPTALAQSAGASAREVAAADPQHDPRVREARVYAIRGATVHTLAGETIENGTVVLRDGVIAAVGSDVAVPQGASEIDASGMHVYPGMLDAMSRLGLTEVGAVSATNDANEMGDWNAHLRAYEAIHPASEHIPVARANGITHAVSAPSGGRIAGQAVLIHLAGWTVEEMAVLPSAGLILSWPTIQTRSFSFGAPPRERSFTEAKREYDDQVAELEEWFEAAKHYRQAVERGDRTRFARNHQLDHLARTLTGELPVVVQANDKRSIEGAMEFAERHGLRLVLAGARDARELKEEIARKAIPVILGPTQTLPSEEDDPYHDPLSLAGELHAAGVKIAFATFNSSDSRTLPYEAANAVPFGLPREEALKAVTVNAAEILGVGDRLGTIEPGKLGNLIVTDGDPLEIQTRVDYVFIRGRPANTMNKHRELWERYRARPRPAEAATVTDGGEGGN